MFTIVRSIFSMTVNPLMPIKIKVDLTKDQQYIKISSLNQEIIIIKK